MLRYLRMGLHRRRFRTRYRLLPELLQAQRMTAAEMRQYQQVRFDDLVRFAARHSPYYRDLLSGRLPATGPIDPRDLPVLRKDDVRAHGLRILVGEVDRDTVEIGHTGGSTGEPLAFYFDALKHERMFAAMMRGFMMSGWRPGERVMYLWGAARDTGRGGVFGGDRPGPLAVECVVAADHYSVAHIETWLAHLYRWCPVVIYGYASVLDAVARLMLEQDRAPPPGLRAVYTTAEPLDAGRRERIEQAFGCKVFNQYGCREVPNIAWECREGGLHVFSDLVHLETLGEGDDAELLVTSLTDRLMPFVRYALGDTGRLLPPGCRCGSPFPRLAMGLCRRNDWITAPDGRRVHPSVLNRLLYRVRGVARYQWVQLSASDLELRLVAPVRLGAEVEAAMADELRRTVAEDLALAIRYVDDLPPNPAGKHRFVIGLADGGVA